MRLIVTVDANLEISILKAISLRDDVAVSLKTVLTLVTVRGRRSILQKDIQPLQPTPAHLLLIGFLWSDARSYRQTRVPNIPQALDARDDGGLE